MKDELFVPPYHSSFKRAKATSLLATYRNQEAHLSELWDGLKVQQAPWDGEAAKAEALKQYDLETVEMLKKWQ